MGLKILRNRPCQPSALVLLFIPPPLCLVCFRFHPQIKGDVNVLQHFEQFFVEPTSPEYCLRFKWGTLLVLNLSIGNQCYFSTK